MIVRSRGFSLVEIMVGLVVGMVCMLVIYQVYGTFEEQKRSTTAGGDAQTNGTLALYLLEREIRVAGNGMTEGEPQKYPPLAGCTTTLYDGSKKYFVPDVKTVKGVTDASSKLVSAGEEATVRLAPAIVTDGGTGGHSDSITVVYGTALITAPYTLLDKYEPGGESIKLTSTVGIKQGDMVVLIQEDTRESGNYITPKRCVLLQVTAKPDATSITVDSGTRYNKKDGTTSQPGFTDEARLYNLGQVNIVTFRVDKNNLVADITKFGVTPDGDKGKEITNPVVQTPLASNIVNMQIQYGVDTSSPDTVAATCSVNSPGIVITSNDADGIIDKWVDAAEAGGKKTWVNDGASTPELFDMRRIRAVRIGLVARSAIKEVPKPDDPVHYPKYPDCSLTTEPIVIGWDNGDKMTPVLGSDTDKSWQCYRYKVFQVTIPIRNAIWSSTMNPASAASCGKREL